MTKLVNISYRQIQYWDKTNFIQPSYRRRGKYRLYIFRDLLLLKIARILRDHSISIQMMRKIMDAVRSLLTRVNSPLVELTLLIQIERDRILIFNGEVITNLASDEIIFKVSSLEKEVNVAFPEQPKEAATTAPSTATHPA